MSFLKNISTPGPPDLELVRAYKQSNDPKLMGVLYERYMELVYGVCLKYLKNTEESKDAVMQIFEELILKIHRYEIDNFRNWLYTLAKNHCLMQLRSPKNIKTVEFNPLVMQSAENEHLDIVFQKEENLQKMEQCLQKLSTEQKESVELFYLQNKCYKEIADITGTDVSKVRSLIQNGRRNLKICIEAGTMVNC
ncbi:MAG: sigma-70 family RNA polymerase sigma factor [Chitinophagaceae bacterium]